MTTPTPRWTAETEELLHRTLHDLDVRINNLTGDHHCNLVTQVALTALADAGVLIPVGGETRQEWRIWLKTHGPFYRLDGEYVTHASGRAHIDRRRLAGYPDPGRLESRIVCETPWREVTDDPA